MKKFIKILIISIFTFSFLTGGVSAELQVDNPEDLDAEVKIQDVDGLRVQLQQKVQNPGNKNITFELKVFSEIDSDRVQIRWNVDGVSQVVEGETFEQLTLSNGENIERNLTVRPGAYGVTRVRAIVEAFEIDGTRVATASKAYFSDQNGSLLLTGAEQQAANVLYYVQQGAIVLLTLLILIVGGIFIYRSFRQWLGSDSK